MITSQQVRNITWQLLHNMMFNPHLSGGNGETARGTVHAGAPLMKKIATGLLTAWLTAASAGSTMAIDYQSMTLNELNALRGTAALTDPTERAAFQAARQEKTQELSPEEQRV